MKTKMCDGQVANDQYRFEQSKKNAQATARLNNLATKASPAQVEPLTDPAAAQLLALFRMSDKRGQDLLLAIAAIHATRYPKVK